jgi:ATP-dependent Lhr-like helicase
VFVAGRPTAFVERAGRSILSFTADPDDLEVTAAALGDLASRRLRRMVVTTVDGAPPGSTALGRALLSRGFVASYRGIAAPVR